MWTSANIQHTHIHTHTHPLCVCVMASTYNIYVNVAANEGFSCIREWAFIRLFGVCGYEGQRTTFYTMWIPGCELRSSGLAASTFTHWAIFSVLWRRLLVTDHGLGYLLLCCNDALDGLGPGQAFNLAQCPWTVIMTSWVKGSRRRDAQWKNRWLEVVYLCRII